MILNAAPFLLRYPSKQHSLTTFANRLSYMQVQLLAEVANMMQGHLMPTILQINILEIS